MEADAVEARLVPVVPPPPAPHGSPPSGPLHGSPLLNRPQQQGSPSSAPQAPPESTQIAITHSLSATGSDDGTRISPYDTPSDSDSSFGKTSDKGGDTLTRQVSEALKKQGLAPEDEALASAPTSSFFANRPGQWGNETIDVQPQYNSERSVISAGSDRRTSRAKTTSSCTAAGPVQRRASLELPPGAQVPASNFSDVEERFATWLDRVEAFHREQMLKLRSMIEEDWIGFSTNTVKVRPVLSSQPSSTLGSVGPSRSPSRAASMCAGWEGPGGSQLSVMQMPGMISSSGDAPTSMPSMVQHATMSFRKKKDLKGNGGGSARPSIAPNASGDGSGLSIAEQALLSLANKTSNSPRPSIMQVSASANRRGSAETLVIPQFEPMQPTNSDEDGTSPNSGNRTQPGQRNPERVLFKRKTDSLLASPSSNVGSRKSIQSNVSNQSEPNHNKKTLHRGSTKEEIPVVFLKSSKTSPKLDSEHERFTPRNSNISFHDGPPVSFEPPSSSPFSLSRSSSAGSDASGNMCGPMSAVVSMNIQGDEDDADEEDDSNGWNGASAALAARLGTVQRTASDGSRLSKANVRRDAKKGGVMRASLGKRHSVSSRVSSSSMASSRNPRSGKNSVCGSTTLSEAGSSRSNSRFLRASSHTFLSTGSSARETLQRMTTSLRNNFQQITLLNQAAGMMPFDVDDQSNPVMNMFRSKGYSIVNLLLICLNCLFTMDATNCRLRRDLDTVQNRTSSDAWPEACFFLLELEWAYRAEMVLYLLFVVEFLIRLFFEREMFFAGDALRWNVCDAFLMVASAPYFIADAWPLPDFMFLRVLRGLQTIQLVGLERVEKFVHTFHVMMYIFRRSIPSLLSTLMVVFCFISSFAIFIGTTTSYHLQQNDEHVMRVAGKADGLFQLNFGTMSRIYFTLWKSTSGGDDWAVLIKPLQECSPALVFFFLTYVCVMVVGVMNVVTGVFVDTAMQISAEDRDIVMKAQRAREDKCIKELQAIFRQADMDGSGTLTWEEFQEHLFDDRLLSYLETLDLDFADAHSLFEILDQERKGEVSIDDFVWGCMRLKGTAKSMDLCTLLYEHRQSTQMIRSCFETLNYRMNFLEDEAGDAMMSGSVPQGDAMMGGSLVLDGRIEASSPENSLDIH